MSKILLTGGFGYVGSHTAAVLAEQNKDFVIYDNFSNSKYSVPDRLEMTINKNVQYVDGDINDTEKLIETLKEFSIKSVIHFAAFKSVRESIINPLKYYQVNVGGTLSLLKAMRNTNVKNLIFSSSATIYGDPEYTPIDENHPLKAINPYGQTKLTVENILRDLIISENDWSIVSLRYFNPVGAHPLGFIGDDPISGKSENLMPAIINVHKGIKPKLEIFGNDYDTKDGTGIRDYIHIMDLARAHLNSIDYIENNSGLNIFNLGTGKGISVLELINTFEKVTGSSLPKVFKERRIGDAAYCYANPQKARKLLKWEALSDVEDMCLSAYNFSKLET